MTTFGINSSDQPHYDTQNSFFAGLFDPLDIKAKVKQIADKTINELNEREIADLKEAFCLSNSYFRSFSGIQDEIAKISIAQMEHFLSKLSQDDDIETILTTYLDTVQDSNLMVFLNFQNDMEVVNSIKIQALVKDKVLKSSFNKQKKAISYEFNLTYKDYLHGLLQTFFFTSPAVIYKSLSSKERLVSATVMAPLIVAWVILGSIFYKKYLEKCPSSIEGMKNLKQTAYSTDEPAYPRQDILNEIEEAFLLGQAVLLVGEPRCGKSQIVKSLVLEIIEDRICPFLNNAEIFSVNASTLLTFFSGVSVEALESQLSNHENQAVFFFDKFESFFEVNDEGRSEVNKIENILDNFQYMIGATTTDKYQKLIHENRLISEGRLKVIHLDLSKRQELEEVVYHHLFEANPEIEIEEDVVPYIVERAAEFKPKTSPIDAVKSLLKRAITKFTDISFHDLDKELVDLKKQQSQLAMKFVNGIAASEELEKITSLIFDKTLEKEIKLIQLEKIEKIEKVYLKVKHKSFEMAKEFPGNSLMRPWLKNEALKKMLGHFAHEKKKPLGLFSKLNKDFIDSIFREKNLKGIDLT